MGLKYGPIFLRLRIKVQKIKYAHTERKWSYSFQGHFPIYNILLRSRNSCDQVAVFRNRAENFIFWADIFGKGGHKVSDTILLT